MLFMLQVDSSIKNGAQLACKLALYWNAILPYCMYDCPFIFTILFLFDFLCSYLLMSYFLNFSLPYGNHDLVQNRLSAEQSFCGTVLSHTTRHLPGLTRLDMPCHCRVTLRHEAMGMLVNISRLSIGAAMIDLLTPKKAKWCCSVRVTPSYCPRM